LRWEFISPAGRVTKIDGALVDVPAHGDKLVELPYVLDDVSAPAYRENRGAVSIVDDRGGVVGSTEVAFSQWTRPIDLRLGGLYLRPEQQQLVRMNLGLAHATLAKVRSVRLDIVRRATGEIVQSLDLPATPAAIAVQRDRIPAGLHGDFANLLLADLDVSKLPLEPFVGPERRWKVRATVIGADGKAVTSIDSAPFCRQSHDQPQTAVATVQLKQNLLYVNQQPWMPWGAAYGFAPAYPGPADPGPGAYRDLPTFPSGPSTTASTTSPTTAATTTSTPSAPSPRAPPTRRDAKCSSAAGRTTVSMPRPTSLLPRKAPSPGTTSFATAATGRRLRS
jgi:hypothetical protein